MDIKDLTPEQLEKAKACENAQQLLDLAKAEGFELNAEQLESISGGDYADNDQIGGTFIS